MNKLLTKIVGVALGATMAVGVGVAAVKASDGGIQRAEAAETTTTYTFTGASWTATTGGVSANWTSGKNGGGFSNNGIQVTTAASGANGTSPISFTNVKTVVLTYHTNKSAGAGTFNIQVGNNTAKNVAWKYSGSSDGRTYNFTATADYSASMETGNVKITVNTTTNSCYLVSCAITASEGGTAHYISSMSAASSIDPLSVTDGSSIDESIFSLKGTKDGVANTDLSSSDYEFLGSGVKNGNTFTPTSDSVYTYGDNSLAWRSKFDTSSSDSTKQMAYFDVDVTMPASADFELVTSISDLEVNKRYVLSSKSTDGAAKFMGAQTSNNFSSIDGTISDGKVTLSESAATFITLGGTTGAYTMHVESGYLCSASSSSNYLKTTTDASAENATWAITIEDGVPSFTANGDYTRNVLRFNSQSSIFACYASGQQPAYLFKEIVTTPTVSITAEAEMTLGDSVPTISVSTENFSGDPTFAWTSSDTTVATVSGTTAVPSITVKAAGSTTLTVTATYGSETASGSCELTVYAAPTTLQVKISGSVATSETVLSQLEGRTRQPTVNILPADADQRYSLSVQSETVSGAFTISGTTINFVKVATGIVRFTSTAKSSVYFDLHVECTGDSYIEDTFAYTGDIATQYAGTKFNPDGLSFVIRKQSAPTTDKAVDLDEISFAPDTLETTTTTVVATHTLSGQSINIAVSVEELVTTPLSSFYDGTIDVSTETDAYLFKGVCIGIVGTSFYIQEGDYGMYVYNHSVDGIAVGKMVLIESTITTYKGLVETSSITSARVIGDGALPAGQIVNSFAGFSALNQSIYASFNGLKINDGSTTYTSIHWTKEWSGTGTKSDGIATIYDSTGAAVTLFVSKHIANGATIVSTLNSIVNTDSFDIAEGVVAMNNNVKQLSLLSADQIIIHHAGDDLIVSWANKYLHMEDESFAGQGTGRCKTDNLYLTAKRALIALGSSLVSDFQNNVGSKYTDALARYNAWASACGDTSPFAGNDIVPAQGTRIMNTNVANSTIAIVVISASILSLAAVGCFFLLRKKKEER